MIGRTRDDAAGEAFDKAARAMGFAYPGGVYIDQAAGRGDPGPVPPAKARVDGAPYDFSFSGLKTAVINLLHNARQKGETVDIDSLAASFQRTVCEVLTDKLCAGRARIWLHNNRRSRRRQRQQRPARRTGADVPRAGLAVFLRRRFHSAGITPR